ncbi:hypothetical protein N7462_003627 [Penicillium macrosclerotiorum]|uniref:uncharacterized protein n=1 Tax=Penicillium macrosclerotiorum TaxID=303699 RepID=UPI002546BAA3|nr:uncharacterized protein N7462_003627 [Penicillium macrosclerotiorum]KAJ5689235.1 hypothetical protein N7462_003627 [Penicillium macrosclerotiorum]
MTYPTRKQADSTHSPPEPTAGPSFEHALYLRDVATQSIQGYSYLGCYSNKPKAPLNATHISFDRLEPQFCCEWCRNVRTTYEFCGVGGGNYCFCGSTTQTDQTLLPESSCNAQCYGDGRYACGGSGAIGLYSATTSFTPITTTGITKISSMSSYSYYGCYTDSTRRVLGEMQRSFQLNDPQFCCDYCLGVSTGYQWCGVENGHNCYCGSTTSSATTAMSTDCSIGCDGAPDVQCGGRWRMNIYSVTVSLPVTTTASTTQTDHVSTETAAATSLDSQSSGLGGGAIAGIVIGAVAGVVLAAILFWILRFRRKRAGGGTSSMRPSELTGVNNEPRELSVQNISEFAAENSQPSELDSHKASESPAATMQRAELEAYSNR